MQIAHVLINPSRAVAEINKYVCLIAAHVRARRYANSFLFDNGENDSIAKAKSVIIFHSISSETPTMEPHQCHIIVRLIADNWIFAQ